MNTRFGSKKANNTFLFICEFLLVCAVVGVMGYTFLSGTYNHDPNILEPVKCIELDEGWYRVYKDGTRESIQFPYVTDGKKNERIVLECRLPDDITDKDWIAVDAVKQDLFFYIDGVKRNAVIDQGYKPYRSELYSRLTFTPLYASDSGKVITIEGLRYTGGSRSFNAPHIGLKYDINNEYLQHNFADIILALTFMIIGLFCVIGGIIMRVITKNTIFFDYMGWAMFCIALWNMTQSPFKVLVFSNVKAISMVPSLALMLLPIPLAMYFNKLQKDRYAKLYVIYVVLSLIAFNSRLYLQMSKTVDLLEGFSTVFVQLYILVIIFVTCSVIDRKRGYRISEYGAIFFGAAALGICGVIQIVLYFKNTSSSTGIPLCAGFLFMTTMAFYTAMTRIRSLQSEKKAAVLNASMKSQFLANMSHEIRTPINAILGMNEVIMRETDQESVSQYASDVNSAGHILLSLINDILDFSKLEAGKLDIIEVPYNLQDMVAACYQLSEKKAGDKNLELAVELDENMPTVLLGDEVRIKQVITNVLSNAVKYTDNGSICLKIGSDNRNLGKLDIVIKVKDTGMGIKEEDRVNLFESFKRLDENKNRNVEGTGLGLAITAQLVRLMNGTISVDSVYGKGSEFTISIPQRILDETPTGKLVLEDRHSITADILANDLFSAPNANILIVDDVVANLTVAASLLKGTGIQIDTAMSGNEALQMVKTKKYDIILLDHMMPGMDGVETLAEMKKLQDNMSRDAHVIMLSANAMVGMKDQYIAEGFHDYLSKPVNGKSIQEMVRKHLPPLLCEPPRSSIRRVQTEDKCDETETLLEPDEEKSSLINMDEAMIYCGGSVAVFNAVAESYVSDDQREKLKAFLDAEDMKQYAIAVHGIKSASKSIGAVTVSEEALKLEMMAKKEDAEGVKASHDAFIALYSELLDELNEKLKKV